MAGWRLKRGMPEWHEVLLYKDTLADGTVIEAYTEDCDGDIEYWGVKENGVLVASGQCTTEPWGTAQILAERIICYGVSPDVIMRTEATFWEQHSTPVDMHAEHT